VSVQIDDRFEGDLQQLLDALGAFPDIAQSRVSGAIEKGLLLLQGRMAVYPPAPMGSTYRRTGTLGRTWTSAARVVEMESGAFVSGRVGNATPYGPWVQHPEDQTAVHKAHGWKTTADVLAESENDIAEILVEAGGSIVQDLAREAEA